MNGLGFSIHPLVHLRMSSSSAITLRGLTVGVDGGGAGPGPFGTAAPMTFRKRRKPWWPWRQVGLGDDRAAGHVVAGSSGMER
jgi:hypothetical protein